MLIGADFLVNSLKGVPSSPADRSESTKKVEKTGLFEAILSKSGARDDKGGKSNGSTSLQGETITDEEEQKTVPEGEPDPSAVLGYVEGGLSSSARLSMPSFMKMISEGQQADSLVCLDALKNEAPVSEEAALLPEAPDLSSKEDCVSPGIPVEEGNSVQWLSGFLEKGASDDGGINGSFSCSKQEGLMEKLQVLMNTSEDDVDLDELKAVFKDLGVSDETLSSLSEELGLDVSVEDGALEISGKSPYFALTITTDEDGNDDDRLSTGSFSLFVNPDDESEVKEDASDGLIDKSDLHKQVLALLSDLILKEGMKIDVADDSRNSGASSVRLKKDGLASSSSSQSSLALSQLASALEGQSSTSRHTASAEDGAKDSMNLDSSLRAFDVSNRGKAEREGLAKEDIATNLNSLIDATNGLKETGDTTLEVLPQRGIPSLPQGISNVVRFLQSNGETKAQVVVDPPALGRVEVELHVVPSGMEASLRVDNVAVRDMIRTQMPLLQDLLAEQGISLSGMSVDVRSGDDQRQQWNGRSAGKRSLDDEEVVDGVEQGTPLARIDLEQGLLVWMA